jgi:hypothetical protein
MGALVDLFFSEEGNEYVLGRLREELATERDGYLTFNGFNVRIEREPSTVTLEDELDPDAQKAMALDDFVRLLMERRPG